MAQGRLFENDAAYCRRGHTLIDYAASLTGRIPSHCPTCGASAVDSCPRCSAPIPGDLRVQFRSYGPPERVLRDRPAFCGQCGSAFPWVDRQGRIYELGNLLDEDPDLEDPERQRALDALRELENPDLDSSDELRLWERVRRAAPSFWARSAARVILIDLVSAALKGKLGL